MTGDLTRLGQRITELRGETPAAVVARRAGIAPAYLHAIEKAAANKTTGEPSKPSVPVLRSIAWAIPGAKASELLDLAGWTDDAVYDRVQEARATRAGKPAPLEERLDVIESTLAEQATTMAEILRAIRAADRRLRDQGIG